MTSWLNCPQKYFASQFSPHITFTGLPIQYASNFKVVWCYLTIHQGEFIVSNLL
jgi:hypothetical protein